MENVKRAATEPLFDKELQNLFGTKPLSRAEVKSIFGPAGLPEKKAPAHVAKSVKPAPVSADWEPVPLTWVDRCIDAAKWVLLFGGLDGLLYYWQTMDLIDAAASGPSMLVCTLLLGWGIGKNAMK